MNIFEVIAVCIALLGLAQGVAMKRAYPESCPIDPALPDLTSGDTITTAASALFAWQLISLTAMGTPFKGQPCETDDAFDMTCIVPDLLDKDHLEAYHEELTQLGIETRMTVAIAKARVGCAANFDTFVAHEKIAGYFEALVIALGTSSPGPVSPPGLGRRNVDEKAILLAQESYLFAWQLGAVLRDVRFQMNMCQGDSLEHLKSGLDLVGMDVGAFVEVYCDHFSEEGLPSAKEAAEQMALVMNKLAMNAK